MPLMSSLSSSVLACSAVHLASARTCASCLRSVALTTACRDLRLGLQQCSVAHAVLRAEHTTPTTYKKVLRDVLVARLEPERAGLAMPMPC